MTIKSPLHDFLIEHMETKPISFHMPGHKGSNLYKGCGYENFLDNFMDCDITEIKGADNLFQTEGVLKQVQERYADLYEVKKSYLQINGSSGANIASILATVPKGKKLIMARNCHKSCFNALTLGDIKPVYVYPEMIEEYGILGAVSPEKIETLIKENDDVEAVILPSPNYYGICSDVEKIAEVVHKYGKVLIIDQAHGAHLKFFNKFGVKGMPLSAEEAGADIIVNSTHKTLASLTESAVLNVNSDRIDLQILEDKLQAIESTSPSYILMASLDINASIIYEKGEALFNKWAEMLNYFYDEIEKIKDIYYIPKRADLDWTKLNFGFGKLGISGNELEDILIRQYNIFIELFTGDLVMCMSGIGNTFEDIDHLITALKEISAGRESAGSYNGTCKKEIKQPEGASEIFDVPLNKRKVKLENAEGLICASSIIPYPPGIPFICPGEKITAEAIMYIKNLRDLGEKVIGVSDTGDILVG